MPLIQEKLSLWDGPQGRHQPHTVPSSFLERNISHFLSAGKGGAALGYPTFHQRSALSWQSPELVTNDFEGLINTNFIRKERHEYSHATTLLLPVWNTLLTYQTANMSRHNGVPPSLGSPPLPAGRVEHPLFYIPVASGTCQLSIRLSLCFPYHPLPLPPLCRHK